MPKSRGRPPGRGRAKRPQRPVRELSLSDHLLRHASSIKGLENVVDVEVWASSWLGQAWASDRFSRQELEQQLCAEVAWQASNRPSAHGLVAVAALRRIAPPNATSVLDNAIRTLSKSQPPPVWLNTSLFEPVKAWRAVDLWDSKHVLFVEFAGSAPHTLMADITLMGGKMVDRLDLVEPEAPTQWEPSPEPDIVPMPIAEYPVADALAELADAMRMADMTLLQEDNETYVDLRALAWSRCRPFLPDWPEPQSLDDEERDLLLNSFVTETTSADTTTPTAEPIDNEVLWSLAEMFLDYGEDYMPSGPLCWSPGWVGMFLTDWLPRKGILDAEQRDALPDILRRWIRFALHRRGIEPQWITPVVEAVDMLLPIFAEMFDDTSTWGPAKHIAAELSARGVDLSDEEAVAITLRGLNPGIFGSHSTNE